MWRFLRAYETVPESLRLLAGKKKKNSCLVVNNEKPLLLICHVTETYIKTFMKDLWNRTHLNFTRIEMRNGSTCRPRVHHEYHVNLLYHCMTQRFLQGSLWVTNYSLKWKCSYSLIKLSAQIRHKSHSVLFCPLNLFSVWVPGFCVLSKHAKKNVLLLCAVKEIYDMKQRAFFFIPLFKLCKLKMSICVNAIQHVGEFMHAYGSDSHTIQTYILIYYILISRDKWRCSCSCRLLMPCQASVFILSKIVKESFIFGLDRS